MSHDSAINAMILNMCAKAQDGVSREEAASPPVEMEGTPGDDGSNSPRARESSLPALRSIDDAPASTKTEEPPHPNVMVAGRNPKDYEWLREALASVESPERQVKRLLDTVEKPDVSKDEMIQALEELSDLVEDINWATEFALMGGPKRMLILLQNLEKNGAERFAEGTSEVRAAVALIISHSSQQHSRVQQCFADAKWADVIVTMLSKEESPTALAALLHACSCLCRNFEPNTISFLQHNGIEVLTSLLQRKRQTRVLGNPIDNKIMGRIFFFVSYLATTGVSSEKLIKLTCEHVEKSNDINHENQGLESMQRSAAMALLELAKKSPSLVKRLVREHMPKQFQAWKKLHACAEDEDPRRAFTDEMEKLGLPEDLLQISSHGGVSCVLHGVSTSGEDVAEKDHSTRERSVVLAPDACLCFTHAGQEKQWRVRLKLFQQQYFDNVEVTTAAASLDTSLSSFSNLTPGCLKRALVLVDDSWVRSKLPRSNASDVGIGGRVKDEQRQIEKPSVSLDAKSLPQQVTSPSTALGASTSNTLTTAGGCRAIQSPASLESLLVSSEHRMLVLAVAHYLGPAPRSVKEILSYIFSATSTLSDAPDKLSKSGGDVIPIENFSLPTSNGRLAYHPEDVEEVVGLLASKSISGMKFELKTEGYALIDLNKYDSRLTKQRVANLAFPKLKSNSSSSVLYPDQLRALELYVDRDLLTRGRGIMSGLGTANAEKRVRSCSLEAAHDEDESELNGRNKHIKEEEHTETKTLAQYKDLYQCGIEWERGDLALLFPTADPQLHECVDLLKNRQARRLTLRQESFRQCQLPSLTITSDKQLVEALRDYRRLYEVYRTLTEGIELHSQVSHRAKAWNDRIGPERKAASLIQQLKEWWRRQQQLREKWLPVYASLQQETFDLEKDIVKYIDLRSLGVI